MKNAYSAVKKFFVEYSFNHSHKDIAMILNLANTVGDLIRTSFLVTLPDAQKFKIGEKYGDPEFEVVIKTQRGLSAVQTCKELNICDAYINGDIDLLGNIDMLKFLAVTKVFSKTHPWKRRFLRFVLFLFKPQIQINKASIAKHYEFDHEFYLLFLDKTRAYSHGIFEHDDETLDVANTRKLEFARSECHLTKGSKVLDLGAGWGCTVEYLGKKGIAVDAITISQKSKEFITKLIQDKKLTQCQVYKKDFLEYQPPTAEYYDALFSLGTLEHLPDYEQVLNRCDHLIKPGGYAYFDASATAIQNPARSDFIKRHIFPGNHECLNVFRFLEAVKTSAFDVISVHNDTHNYYLTLKVWAQNLDKNKNKILKKWDESLYRKFHIYLWGCSYMMLHNQLQAYRIVLRKRA
jgi:cyclopropane-fatty-acyl-phospholipid synthase